MQTHTIALRERTTIAEGTMRLDFEKPKGFTFLPGQYVIMTLTAPAVQDAQRNFRSFSIASAPHEDVLTFIMRESDSGVKQSLKAMTPGETVEIKGPLGHFTLPENTERPIVFLTAGVGITPVRSMLRAEEQRDSARTMTLIDSNRTMQSAPCVVELHSLTLDNYMHHCLVTDKPEKWDFGYCGFVDAAFLKEQLDDVHAPLYYIVGTKGFVEGMKSALAELAVAPEQIVVDNFG